MREQDKKDKSIPEMGDYMYKKVLNLVRGCYAKQMEAGVPIVGYKGWSPNNVKRLLLSTDCAIIEHHTTTNMKNKKFEIARFEGCKVQQCVQSNKYKSMISALSTNKICSAIEEIVIFTQSKCDIPMNNSEANVTPLMRGNNYKGVKLEERYRRLHDISIANTTIDVAYNLLRENDAESLTSLLEEKGIKVGRTEINNPNWKVNKPRLQSFGADQSAYMEDCDDGAVGTHFRLIIERYEKQATDGKLKEIELKRNSKDVEMIQSAIEIIECSILASKKICKLNKGIIKSGLSNLISTNSEMDNYRVLFGKDCQGAAKKTYGDKLTNKGVLEVLKRFNIETSQDLKNLIQFYLGGAGEEKQTLLVSDVSGVITYIMVQTSENLYEFLYKTFLETASNNKLFFNVKCRSIEKETSSKLNGLQGSVIPQIAELVGIGFDYTDSINKKNTLNNYKTLLSIFCSLYNMDKHSFDESLNKL